MASRISGFDDIHQGAGGKAGGFNPMGRFILSVQWLIWIIAIRSRAGGRVVLTGISGWNRRIKGQALTGDCLFTAYRAP
jgi:hypothetical protein